MSSTLATIRGYVRSDLHMDPNGKVFSDSVVNVAINRAYSKVQQDLNFKSQENFANQSISTIGGTQEYSLETNFIRLELARCNGDKLTNKDYIALKVQYNTFTSGRPIYYYIRNSKIGFVNVPDSTYTIDVDYRKRLTDLSSDSDTIAFPVDYDEAIIKYTSHLLLSTLRINDNEQQVKLRDYNEQVKMLKNMYILNDTANLTYGINRRTITYRDNVIY